VRAALASGNAHKLEELAAALPGWELRLVETGEPYPPEDGDTYEANARGKAVFGRRFAAADEWALGEDSGIEAAALGGAPGVASARWAEDGVAELLRRLDGVDDRRARYVCTIVALDAAGAETVVVGRLEGTLADERRGSQGFGYDPIFVPDGETRTVAELGNAWKREHSHRARAAAALREALATEA
jgi:XTP/dITP diphosphohydrolase